MFAFDERISSKLDGLVDGYPVRVFLATLFAKYVLWGCVGAAVIVYRLINQTQEGESIYFLLLVVTIGLPYFFTLLLSLLVRRKRPYERLPDAWHLPIRLYTPSFPSGHTTIAFATFSFLVLYWHPVTFVTVGLLCLASSIALARVLVGVHYVTDIVAGAVIGGGGAWLVFTVLEKMILLTWR